TRITLLTLPAIVVSIHYSEDSNLALPKPLRHRRLARNLWTIAKPAAGSDRHELYDAGFWRV
ncbi:MAG: hypothetical protein ACP5QR_00885, partial [Rhizomicrobium sp.]